MPYSRQGRKLEMIQRDQDKVTLTITCELSGRAVRDAALRSRKGQDETLQGMIEIGKHLLNKESTEEGEVKSILST